MRSAAWLLALVVPLLAQPALGAPASPQPGDGTSILLVLFAPAGLMLLASVAYVIRSEDARPALADVAPSRLVQPAPSQGIPPPPRPASVRKIAPAAAAAMPQPASAAIRRLPASASVAATPAQPAHVATALPQAAVRPLGHHPALASSSSAALPSEPERRATIRKL